MAQRIKSTLEELYRLRERIKRHELDPDDWPLFDAFVLKLIARTEATQARVLAKIAAEADHSLPEASSTAIDAECMARDGEGSPDGSDPKGTGVEGSNEGSDGPLKGAKPDDRASKPAPKRRGHGRNGAGAYTKAEHVFHALIAGVLGALCDRCKRGPLSRYREKVIIRIVGQPLFGAQIHHFEQARCRLCGNILRAMGSAGVLEGVGTSYIVYAWSACAMLIVMHYFAGAPFKRLESLHKSWGIPLPDTNQWNTVDASDELLWPLFQAMERYGIEHATSLRIDDTGSMVITIKRQIQAELAALELIGESTKDVRTGINATGLYLETENEKIVLFYTGRHHAGEIIDQLLRHRRSSSPKLAKVTDGASKNFDHEHADKLIEGTCNAHAFLKFRDVKDNYPDEYALAGEIYKKVFDNDDITKEHGMTPTVRMLYHREHSLPLLENLKAMCVQKIRSKWVEPHSLLWEPLTFVINQWPRLIKFCQEPGVPLDTNLVEQTLIIPVRYLASSFNYQTVNGAEVGDRHMSLIATARVNGVEPVAYLADCLSHHEDLAKRPEYYFPWVYHKRLKHRDKTPHALDPLQSSAA